MIKTTASKEGGSLVKSQKQTRSKPCREKGDGHLTSQLAVGERRLKKVTEPHFVSPARKRLRVVKHLKPFFAATELHRSSVQLF
jgi:hypothetical protein